MIVLHAARIISLAPHAVVSVATDVTPERGGRNTVVCVGDDTYHVRESVAEVELLIAAHRRLVGRDGFCRFAGSQGDREEPAICISIEIQDGEVRRNYARAI